MKLIDADRLKLELLHALRYVPTHIWYAVLRYINDAPAVEPPPNEPLTLEELRGMDGEPVWNDTTKKWAIVDIYSQFGPRAIIQGGRWRPLDDRYYRHRPEGEKIGGNRQ